MIGEGECLIASGVKKRVHIKDRSDTSKNGETVGYRLWHTLMMNMLPLKKHADERQRIIAFSGFSLTEVVCEGRS
jgi:hypothetical protein